MKKALIILLATVMAFSTLFTSCGIQGATGEKGEKGEKGDKGDNGTSPTVTSCEKTGIDGLTDTYTVTFSDGSTYTFTVGNGEKGEKGENGISSTVVSCEKTATDGLVDTYTITFSDGSTAEFKVTNAEASATVSEISYVESGAKYKITYSDGTSTQFAVSESYEVTKAYTDAIAMGYEGEMTEYVLDAVNLAKTALLDGGSPMEAKVFGSIVPVILEKFDTYFKNDRITVSSVTETITETSGYMAQNGEAKPNSATQSYVYTNIIPCEPGETVEVFYNGNALGFRFITAYSDGVCKTSASMDCNNQTVKSYVVPEGINGVIFTYQKRSTVPEARRSVYEIMPVSLDTLNVNEVNKLYYGEGGGQSVSKNNSIVANLATLGAGEYLKLENNHIMNNKVLSLSFKLEQMSDSDVIRLGHGESVNGGSYIELTKTTLKVYNYYNADRHEKGEDVALTQEHGLTLSGVVNITITTYMHNADILITTSSGMFSKTVSWAGRNGEIFAYSAASALTDVRMRWYCSAYESDVWLMGDSYFNFGSSARWPYYLRTLNYSGFMLTGYSGRNSTAGLEDFKQALTHGTPKYAIWCLGMNDGDVNSTINANYIKCVQEFIALCEENGITPILSTVPCTPTVNNYYKNDWVRKSGYRYIDFARAVGGEEIGSNWYSDMLNSDNVHPNDLGAKALFGQFIADFPEISKNKLS